MAESHPSSVPARRPGRPIRNLKDQVFGRLTVLHLDRIDKVNGKSRVYWWCRCECGNEKAILAGSLRCDGSGTVSCGCFHEEQLAAAKHKHGDATGVDAAGNRIVTTEYNSWIAMCYNCRSPKSSNWKACGGRGVKVIDRWLGEHGYENFLNDMGRKPSPVHQIVRKDTFKDFSPENCFWGTRADNAVTRIAAHLTPAESKQRRHARVCIREALKAGKIDKPDHCQFPGCTSNYRLFAHHWHGYDLSHVLDVQWLCQDHHTQADKESPHTIRRHPGSGVTL
jgi:hypothetical protein